jgi:hypothetical protein
VKASASFHPRGITSTLQPLAKTFRLRLGGSAE